jgi:phytoene synthase
MMRRTSTSIPTTAKSKQRRDPASVLAASTFSAGLILLPSKLRSDARRLYYLLRAIDDLVDEQHPHAEQRIAAIESWAHRRLPGQETAETRILTKLAQDYPIDEASLLEFCAGMRHDLSNATIDTEADLERYCEQVAGTVGIMLTALLGTSHPDGAQKMATLGRAMQRTNILRDIDEDLTRGRLYIPRAAIKQFGFPCPGRRENLLRDQIARADVLYEEGHAAIGALRDGREAMAVSAALYQEILRQIEREGYGLKPGRAIVPAWRKHQIIRRHAPNSKPIRNTRPLGTPKP